MVNSVNWLGNQHTLIYRVTQTAPVQVQISSNKSLSKRSVYERTCDFYVLTTFFSCKLRVASRITSYCPKRHHMQAGRFIMWYCLFIAL